MSISEPITDSLCDLKSVSDGYGVFARFYDKLQKASGTDYGVIGDYYKKILHKNGIFGGILLDLACGTGVLSRYFENAGYDVIGADTSADMLGVAVSENRGADIRYLLQDMTDLDLYGTVDACICVLDGINHLTSPDEVKKVFGKVSLFMNSGGMFVFDVNTVHKHENILAGSSFAFDLEELFCSWRNFGNSKEKGLIGIELDFFEKNKNNCYTRFSESFSEKAYNLDVIEHLLVVSGFEVTNRFDWLTFEAGGEGCEKVVFSAIKK